MDFLSDTAKIISSLFTDYLPIFLLAFSGIYFTIKTRFIQVRCFVSAIKNTFRGVGKSSRGTGITSFQALMTSVGAQVGTGNIIGVCSAILIGGAGAVFWIWVMAFFGMATAYCEGVLAQQTRFTDSKMMLRGGPAYYIKKAFGGAFGEIFSRFFSFATVVALGFSGCAVQSNAIANTTENAFGVHRVIVGAVLAAVCVFIFKSGISTTAKLSEKTVPVMAALYIIGCLALLIFKAECLPRAFYMIFYGAAKPHALIGGSFAYALKTCVSQGAKRGLFSNEAGMGSVAHAHALAEVSTPHEQGLAAMVSVFIDTFVVLSLTAMVAVCFFCTGEISTSGIDENNMIQCAFSFVFGEKAGSIFVSVCLFFFSFSSIVSWNYFGKMNFDYLFGSKREKIYIFLSCFFIFCGSIFGGKAVWSSADIFSQLMVIPNVAALIRLNKNITETVDNRSTRGIIFSENTEK